MQDLTDADLTGVRSGGISGRPSSLPDGWSLVDGELINDEWGSSTPPDDSGFSDMPTNEEPLNFYDIDEDGDGCISEEEFEKLIVLWVPKAKE